MSELRFYVDECVQPAVAEQLVFHGIDAVSAHTLGQLGDKDVNHLIRAAEMGRVFAPMIPIFWKWRKQRLIMLALYLRLSMALLLAAWSEHCVSCILE